MAWWNKLFGDSGPSGRVAYYDEGLALIAEDKVHEALTSFRLALKESPGDARAALQGELGNAARVGTYQLRVEMTGQWQERLAWVLEQTTAFRHRILALQAAAQ